MVTNRQQGQKQEGARITKKRKKISRDWMLGESTELCIITPKYTRKDQESPGCKNPLKSKKNKFNLSQ